MPSTSLPKTNADRSDLLSVLADLAPIAAIPRRSEQWVSALNARLRREHHPLSIDLTWQPIGTRTQSRVAVCNVPRSATGARLVVASDDAGISQRALEAFAASLASLAGWACIDTEDPDSADQSAHAASVLASRCADLEADLSQLKNLLRFLDDTTRTYLAERNPT